MLVPVLGAALAICLTIYLGNYLSNDTPTNYLQVWSGTAPHLESVYWIKHGFFLMQIFIWNALLGAPHFPASRITAVFSISLLIAGIILFIYGLRRLEERDKNENKILFLIYSFCSLYFLVHAAWPLADPRFFLVLLPFALLAIVAGAWDTGGFSLRRPWIFAALGLWLLSYGHGNARMFLEPPRTSAARQAPMSTFSWIETNTPPSARFWGFYDSPMIELYTGRAGVSLPVPPDDEAFLYQLLDKRVDYLYYAPMRLAFAPVRGIERVRSDWNESRRWAASWDSAFKPVYANREESTAIYQVLRSDSFQKAYSLYLAALDDFKQARWAEGLARLEEALRWEPRLVSALNAYGATCLITGRNLGVAQRRLEEALRLRPDHVLARLNLLRVRRKMGRAG